MAQLSEVDAKIRTLHDLYQDREYAKSAQKEVEDIRRRSYLLGITTSGAALLMNEGIRLTSRSRNFNS